MPIQETAERGKRGIAVVADASASPDADKAMASLEDAVPAAIDDHLECLLREHGVACTPTPSREQFD